MLYVYKSIEKNDECYTPAYAVEPLLKYLEKFKGKTIWCPFDKEESEFVKVLKSAGHKVIYTHKETGVDFYNFQNDLLAEKAPDFDLIVSNPPFSNKAKIVEVVQSFKKPFALMLPMTWLNDSAPYRLFNGGGLELMIFNRRVRFLNCGSQPSFAVGYFCNGILPDKIVFEKLDIK